MALYPEAEGKKYPRFQACPLTSLEAPGLKMTHSYHFNHLYLLYGCSREETPQFKKGFSIFSNEIKTTLSLFLCHIHL